MKEKKKQLIIIFAVLILTIVGSAWINLQRGLFLGENFFGRLKDGVYQYNKENRIEAVVTESGAEFQMQIDGTAQTAVLRWTEDMVVVRYNDGTEIAGRWDKYRDEGQLLDESGVPLALGNMEILLSGDERPDWGKIALSNVLCQISLGESEARGSLWITLVGAILYLIGAVSFLFPNETYFFMRSWAFKEAELSETGYAMQKYGGVFAMAAGAAFAIFTVWLV